MIVTVAGILNMSYLTVMPMASGNESDANGDGADRATFARKGMIINTRLKRKERSIPAQMPNSLSVVEKRSPFRTLGVSVEMATIVFDTPQKGRTASDRQ
jgi:hypothetical protein